MLGGCDYLVLERSLYDVCLCDYFRGDGCAGTATLVKDAVYETTLRASAGWGIRTGDFGFSYDGDVG